MEENNINNQHEENNLVNKVDFDNNKSEEKNNNLFWKGMLILGLCPYFLLIIELIHASIFGTEFLGSHTYYGLEAFFLVIALAFVCFWFIYIPATILIIVSIIKISKNKSKK